MKISTFASGTRRMISSVASIPSISGMRRSITITSGRRRSVERYRRLAVGGLADDADVRRAQQREAQALADDLVVVGEEHGDLGGFGHGAILRVRSDEGQLRRSRPRPEWPGVRRPHARAPGHARSSIGGEVFVPGRYDRPA